MTKTFEEQILSDVVKQVMTPEKMAAMAERLGPQIEKKLEKAALDGISSFLEDRDWYDVFYETDVRQHLDNLVRNALGLPSTTKKKRR